MVAPSFQTYKVISEEPFLKNGKLYITVEHPNTKNHRDVRWYSDAEYAKAYGNKSKNEVDKSSSDVFLGPFAGFKNCRGFKEGEIKVIRGAKSSDLEWLNASPACFMVQVGWYIPSTVHDFPFDKAPRHFTYIPIAWEEFRDKDDSHIKSPAAMESILRGKEKKM